jgi:hypothetical protein
MEQTTSQTQSESDSVECPAGKDRAVRLFIVSAAMIAVGLWCAYEVFILKQYPHAPFSIDKPNEFLAWAVNTIAPLVLIPGSLILAGLTLVYRRGVLSADAQGIGYRGKEQIAWGDIKRIDAQRIRKGFLDIYHGPGAKRKFVLDSWKLQNFKALVAFIEQHVPSEIISR